MKPIAKGECDACPKTGDLFQYPGSKLSLCVTCYQAEVKAIEDSKWINSTLQTAKVIDSSIKRKADIFNAATMSFGELYSAIQHDDSITSDKKTSTFMQMIETRITGLSSVIFGLKEQVLEKENEREGWRQSTVDFISKLRTEEREKYAKFNVTYAPPVVTKKAIKGSTPKSVKVDKAPKVVIKMHDLKVAAIQYGVPMSTLKSMCELRNMDVDTAGKLLASAGVTE